MDYKVLKETLTDENIKKDMMKNAYNEEHNILLDRRVFSAFVFPILLIISIFLLENLILSIAFAVVSIFNIILIIPVLRHSREDKRKIDNLDFIIVRDKLSHISKETVYEHSRYGDSDRDLKEVTVFNFESRSWRVVPTKTHYDWSKTYYMSTTGLCNTSLMGDEFYIVINKTSHKIAYVYNTKLFEYKGYKEEKI